MDKVLIVVIWMLSEFFIAYYQKAKDLTLSKKQKLMYSAAAALIGTMIAASSDIASILRD
ncbi:MAG: hypothetical protein ACOYVK_06705 [Bacillota bacterium]